MLESAKAVFDALYGRFLLRDVFGKLVPGWIAVSAVLLRFDVSLQLLAPGLTSPVASITVGAGVAVLGAVVAPRS